VTERAKDQLQAVFRLESDREELLRTLATHGLADVADKVKALKGLESAADLAHLTLAEIRVR
jgi:hypothetical protein